MSLPNLTPLYTMQPHVAELRRRLVIASSAFFACFLASLIYSDRLMAWLIQPAARYTGPLYFFSPSDAFFAQVQLAALAGFLISLPVILAQMWLFAAPALYEREKHLIVPLSMAGTALFLTGAALAFFCVVPWTYRFLLGYQSANLKPMIGITQYMGFMSSMVLSFGIAFELPLAVLALVRLGWVGARSLTQYRRHVWVVMAILAAVLTPPDAISMLMLLVPLVGLYELSVWIAHGPLATSVRQRVA